MSVTRANVRQLRTLFDTLALCAYLADATNAGANCQHTFDHTRAYFAEYDPSTDVETIIVALQGLGLACDCEVGFQVGPLVGA